MQKIKINQINGSVQHWPLLATKKSWPFWLEEKMVLSRLYYAARKDEPLGPTQIANQTWLDYKTVSKSLALLEQIDLVQKAGAKWIAIKPDERHRFLVPGAESKHWASSFVCFPLYMPALRRNLRSAAMLSLIIDLCRQKNGVINRTSPAHLALLLGVTGKSAAKYLKQLQVQKLITIHPVNNWISIWLDQIRLDWFLPRAKSEKIINSNKSVITSSVSGLPISPKPKSSPPTPKNEGEFPDERLLPVDGEGIPVLFEHPVTQSVYAGLRRIEIPHQLAGKITVERNRLGGSADWFFGFCWNKHQYHQQQLQQGKALAPHAGFLILSWIQKMKEQKFQPPKPRPSQIIQTAPELSVDDFQRVLLYDLKVDGVEAAVYVDRLVKKGRDPEDAVFKLKNCYHTLRKYRNASSEERTAWVNSIIDQCIAV